jgi:hypothetical protein
VTFVVGFSNAILPPLVQPPVRLASRTYIPRVKDSHGATALQAFQVFVAANSPPIFTAVPLGPAVVGRP